MRQGVRNPLQFNPADGAPADSECGRIATIPIHVKIKFSLFSGLAFLLQVVKFTLDSTPHDR